MWLPLKDCSILYQVVGRKARGRVVLRLLYAFSTCLLVPTYHMRKHYELCHVNATLV